MAASKIRAAESGGLTCWVLSEGMAGTENQCLALAAGLGLTPEIKRAAAKPLWRWLGAAMAVLPPQNLAQGRDSLAPPWPDLLIASGRKCTGLALAIRRASGGRTFTVFVQNPRLGLSAFDLIVVPRHDGLAGAGLCKLEGDRAVFSFQRAHARYFRRRSILRKAVRRCAARRTPMTGRATALDALPR